MALDNAKVEEALEDFSWKEVERKRRKKRAITTIAKEITSFSHGVGKGEGKEGKVVVESRKKEEGGKEGGRGTISGLSECPDDFSRGYYSA